jgi:hypothetical protein
MISTEILDILASSEEEKMEKIASLEADLEERKNVLRSVLKVSGYICKSNLYIHPNYLLFMEAVISSENQQWLNEVIDSLPKGAVIRL